MCLAVDVLLHNGARNTPCWRECNYFFCWCHLVTRATLVQMAMHSAFIATVELPLITFAGGTTKSTTASFVWDAFTWRWLFFLQQANHRQSSGGSSCVQDYDVIYALEREHICTPIVICMPGKQPHWYKWARRTFGAARSHHDLLFRVFIATDMLLR